MCRIVVSLIALLFLGRIALAQESWTGKVVYLTKNGESIRQKDEKGNAVPAKRLNALNFEVLDEKERWLKIRTDWGILWIEKDGAVLREDAVEFFTQRLKQNPNNIGDYLARAAGWCHKGEYDRAIQDADESIRRQPTVSGYLTKGRIYLAKKDYDKALDEFTEAIRRNPKYADAYVNRGHAWNSKKDHEKAITDFSEAARLDSKNVAALTGRSYSWRMTNKLDEALVDVNEILRLDPGNVYALHQRGNLWEDKNEYVKALDDWNKAIELSPKYGDAHIAVARLLACCPDPTFRDGPKAVEAAKRALDLKPKYSFYLGVLAAALAEIGDFNGAIQAEEAAISDAEYADEGANKRLQYYRAKKEMQ